MAVDTNLLLLTLLNGLAVGFLYVLISSGLSVIFGLTDIINFAHGVFYMLGAYLGLTLYNVTGNFFVALVLVPFAVAAIGMVIERTTLHHIYDRDPLYQIILTFAFILILTDVVEIIWGRRPQQYNIPDALTGVVDLGPIVYPTYRLFLIVLAALICLAVVAVFRYTNFGLIIRASAQRSETSRLLGVNVSNYFTLVFGFGTLLAGIAGVLAGPILSVNPEMGQQIIILAFIVVILGGLGSFTGAVIAGLVIGVFQTVGNTYLPELTGFFIFIVMIGVLLVRPEGILGKYNVRREDTKISLGSMIEPVKLSDRRIWPLLGVLVLVPLGEGVGYSSYYVGLLALMFVWGILVLSLDLLTGYLGLISFGHAMFFGIGAYLTALLVIHVYNSLLLALAASVIATAVVAYVIGYLSIRLSGVYFAVITLGFAEIFYQLSLTLDDVTGGSDGLALADVQLFGVGLGDTSTFYYVAFVALLALYWLSVWILDSPFGRAIIAIRESERRMAFLGYNTNKFKRRTFVISGAIAGIAGTLLTTYQSFVSPSTLSWVVSGDMIVAMILGGLGTLYGAIIGAAVFIGMSEVLSSYFDNWRLLFGFLILLVIIFQPRGLASLKSTLLDRLQGRSGPPEEIDEPTETGEPDETVRGDD